MARKRRKNVDTGICYRIIVNSLLYYDIDLVDTNVGTDKFTDINVAEYKIETHCKDSVTIHEENF